MFFSSLLSEMYLENEEIMKAREHAVKAQDINPDHEGPRELMRKIEDSSNN